MNCKYLSQCQKLPLPEKAEGRSYTLFFLSPGHKRALEDEAMSCTIVGTSQAKLTASHLCSQDYCFRTLGIIFGSGYEQELPLEK